MDELFADSLGYLVYQEQIIAALIKLCGFTGGQADSVRRDIAKKKEDKVAQDVIKIREGYCERSSQPREIAEKECEQMLQVIKDASGYSFNYNHAAAYSLVTYIFAWLKYYHPVEFITAYLNNAGNDDDIATGMSMAKKRGIVISMPKFGLSRDGYGCDVEQRKIAQGLASIKDFGPGQGEGLYQLNQQKEYTSFTDLLLDIKTNGIKLNKSLIEKLILLDFFSPKFGNQRMLLMIKSFYDRWVDKVQVKYAEYDETPLKDVIRKWFPCAKEKAKTGKLTDFVGLMHDYENYVASLNVEDAPLVEKAKNFNEIMGFNGYVTGKEEDKMKVFVKKIIPLNSKKTGQLWAYLFKCQSLGSGKENTLTVRPNVFDRNPIECNAFIECGRCYQDKNGYWNMTDYKEIA